MSVEAAEPVLRTPRAGINLLLSLTLLGLLVVLWAILGLGGALGRLADTGAVKLEANCGHPGRFL